MESELLYICLFLLDYKDKKRLRDKSKAHFYLFFPKCKPDDIRTHLELEIERAFYEGMVIIISFKVGSNRCEMVVKGINTSFRRSTS